MSEETKEQPTRNAWQDWKRTIVSTATIVLAFSVYYHQDHEQTQTQIAKLETALNSHCASSKLYTLAELDERFVSRREWDSSKGEISALRDEIRYLRNKIDAIYERLTDKK